MGNFLQYMQSKKQTVQLNEAFRGSDKAKMFSAFTSLFKKKIEGGCIFIGYMNMIIGDDNLIGYVWISKTKKSIFTLNIKNSASSLEVHSVGFWKSSVDFWNEKPADTVLYTLGTSVTYFVPIIISAINSNDFSFGKKDVMNKISGYAVAESRSIWFGAQKYTIYENVSSQSINVTFNMIAENDKRDVKKLKNIYADERNKAWWSDRNKAKQIETELEEINTAIKGGARTIEDIKCAIKHKMMFSLPGVKEATGKFETKLNAEKKDPQLAFKEMASYINMVIKGIQHSCIICGAPGVGKTYKVTKQLENAGYEDEKNMLIVKGKLTTRRLYVSLYEHRAKDHIVIIDDADSVVGPKADENSINILKAALDSSPKRKVMYGIAGKILDDNGNEIPKSFEFEGGVIILTNYSAGQLDTALRGRSFIQTLDFDTQQMLSVIEGLIPHMQNDVLSLESKQKAYEYMMELAKQGDFDISIRTFCMSAQIFESMKWDEDMTDEIAQSMINEQMKNQSLRGGKKF